MDIDFPLILVILVFGSGLITTSRMAREGFALNLMGALVISAVCYVMLT